MKSLIHKNYVLNALLTGRVVPFGSNGSFSAIHKQPANHAIQVTFTGLAGDAQADRIHHGGIEKALHHYPLDHYPYWYAYLHAPPTSLPVGAFGENLSTSGLTEDDVCIGDVFKLGSSVIQVTQPRQPCWKLNARFNHVHIARHMQRMGMTGWYYRVVKEGDAAPQEELIFSSRPNPQWNIARVVSLLYKREEDRRSIEELANAAGIGKSLSALLHKRLRTGQVESWADRLGGYF